jgi:predicted DCC family thiol-disulfide oxidoreductase YuxK
VAERVANHEANPPLRGMLDALGMQVNGRFVLAEDQSAQGFSFAPLQGDFVRRRVPEHIRAQLPDSLVVIDEKDNILSRLAAVIYVMKRLGGMWFLAASVLSL